VDGSRSSPDGPLPFGYAQQMFDGPMRSSFMKVLCLPIIANHRILRGAGNCGINTGRVSDDPRHTPMFCAALPGVLRVYSGLIASSRAK